MTMWAKFGSRARVCFTDANIRAVFCVRTGSIRVSEVRRQYCIQEVPPSACVSKCSLTQSVYLFKASTGISMAVSVGTRCASTTECLLVSVSDGRDVVVHIVTRF